MTESPSSCPILSERSPYLILAAFAVAMGLLEAAVIVYLRELYHPGGFLFPLQPLPAHMASTEMGREVATVVMIWAVAHLSGRSGRDRFAAFAFVFGIWDIFYYIWLKVLIGWPEGLLDPDILFLIPLPWVGPVLAPVLVSIVLILLSFNLRPPGACPGPPARVNRSDWALYLAGAALVIWTFMEPNLGTTGLARPVVFPVWYDWTFFPIGLALGGLATIRLGLTRRRGQIADAP